MLLANSADFNADNIDFANAQDMGAVLRPVISGDTAQGRDMFFDGDGGNNDDILADTARASGNTIEFGDTSDGNFATATVGSVSASTV